MWKRGLRPEGELMRSLIYEVNKLNETKKDDNMEDGCKGKLIGENEQNIEELELKTKLLGSELEELRNKLPDIDKNESGKQNRKILISFKNQRRLCAKFVKFKCAYSALGAS